MIAYYDSSALVKRYLEEEHSSRVRERLHDGLVATARFSESEIVSALARRCREGAFPESERERALNGVRRDFIRGFYLVELTQSVVLRSRGLLLRHFLRAADALQLASCMELASELGLEVPFLTFDERLREAAQVEGLKGEL